ncbi:MAG: hypothetical protein S4CHLAM102_13780 [Chlamydiia bacterium]|nr:hypothetical protein [Chlamydiia bacterium]
MKWLIAQVLSWWWTGAFICGVLLVQSHMIGKKQVAYQALQSKLTTLEVQRKEALLEQEELVCSINSQSDPEWVRMTLMKGLGVVPEGQTKVLFK